MNAKHRILLTVLLGLTACVPPPTLISTIIHPTVTPASSTATQPLPTEPFTPRFTESRTPTNTPTPLPTPAPIYTTLRGEVLERANCRYGPGWPYLYKYGLVVGSNLDVIGRLDDASWLHVQAIGGDNPCWVKASLMDVKGDVFTIEPIYPDKAPLPQSPYYAPLTGVSTTRLDDQITITWFGQTLRAGDEESVNTPIYIVEIWACEDGQIKFTPYGLFIEELTITDEAGCDKASHGRVYFSEKHGYAGPTELEWPER